MDNVVSIRFALVARSYENNAANGQTYDVLGTSITSTDRRLRQVYTATIGVRNRLP
jgi:type IV pilus assembly protein PilW